MARTIAEIYDSLNTVKQNMSELGVYVNNDAESLDTAKKLVNDVRSNSRVAVWRLWLWIMAVASWIVEKLQDKHEAKINELIAIDKPHTLNWYATESLKFQYGYEMLWNGEIFSYPKIDGAARIIKHSAASEAAEEIVIKVLKQDKEILSQAEMTAFQAFWRRWRDAGVTLRFVSEIPNPVQFTATIHRNRNIVNEDNTLIADPTTNVVHGVINGYCEKMQYDDTFNMHEVLQLVKSQPGINNMIFSAITGTGVELLQYGMLRLNSGFAKIEWSACNITYIDTYD